MNPALAKVASDAIFGRQQTMKDGAELAKAIGHTGEVKSLGDVLKVVKSATSTLQAVGGEKGITDMQDSVADYEKEIGQFSAGDPELVAQLHEGNPEGFVKNVGNGLSLLLQKNNAKPGDLFDRAITPAFNSKIQNAGMPRAVDIALELLTAGKPEEAAKMLGNMKAWMENVDNYAKELQKGAENKNADPREQELSERERSIQQAEVARYEGDIKTDVNKLNNAIMAPMLEGLFKTLKLDPDGKREFTDLLQSKVWKTMQADEAFQRNARNVMAKNKKDPSVSARFVNAKFNEIISGPDGMFVRLRNQMYPHLATAGKKAAPAAARPGAAKPGAPPPVKVQVNARPKHEDVDWGKTTDIDWIRGEATLKDGKRHKFDPNSPPNRL